jgi:hypothetical protein
MAITFRQGAGAESVATGTTTANLGLAPVAGNLLVAWLAKRESIGCTFTGPGATWTLIKRTSTSAGDNWPCAMYARPAQTGDLAAHSWVSNSIERCVLVVAELVGAGLPEDIMAFAGPSTGESTVSINPTAGREVAIVAGGAVRRDTATSFTPAAGFVEIFESAAAGGPQTYGAYRLIPAAAGPYTAGETYGGGSPRGVVAAAFPAVALSRGFPRRFW